MYCMGFSLIRLKCDYCSFERMKKKRKTNFNHCINKHVIFSLLFRSNLVFSMSFSHSFPFHTRTHAVYYIAFNSPQLYFTILLSYSVLDACVCVCAYECVCIFFCSLLVVFLLFLLHPHVSVYFDILFIFFLCCSFHQSLCLSFFSCEFHLHLRNIFFELNRQRMREKEKERD